LGVALAGGGRKTTRLRKYARIGALCAAGDEPSAAHGGLAALDVDEGRTIDEGGPVIHLYVELGVEHIAVGGDVWKLRLREFLAELPHVILAGGCKTQAKGE
jgi:hypothetical protein